MTGRDLITAALRLIGASAPGESIASAEATDGLSAFNRMLGSWSTDGLLIYAETQETPFTLTAGDATVTMGTSGDITTRPQEIVKAVIRDGSTDHPVDILSISEWASITNKSVQSTYPRALYDDGGYPQRIITLYPVPSAAKSLILWTKRPLTEISTLDTTISLPPGYEEALIYNLAIRLAPEYGKVVPDAVVLVATESKAGLKRANRRPSYLQVDEALTATGGRFNFDTGDYSR